MQRRKKVTTKTLVELAEIVLKNNVFQFNEKTLKQLRGTASTYLQVLTYAAFQNVRCILEELQILLPPDKGIKKFFSRFQ